MELLSSSEFWTIVAVVVSALGLQRAMKADRRREMQELRAEMEKRFEEAEERRKAGEKWLAEQIRRLKQDIERQIAGVRKEIRDVKQELGHRIDRLEDRMAENQREMSDRMAGSQREMSDRMADSQREMSDRMADSQREMSDGFAETKAAISALNAKLDERSSPRRLEGTGLASATGPVASGAVVREPSGSYSREGSQGEAEPVAPKDSRHDEAEERSDQA